jgi:hypothetical protein
MWRESETAFNLKRKSDIKLKAASSFISPYN